MAKQVRDNAYYMDRLEKDHPVVFADWKAGRYLTPREAFIAAGLRKEPKPLNALKNAWSKATAAEQSEFLKWVRAGITPPSSPLSGPSRPTPSRTPANVSAIVGPDGRLMPKVKARIRLIKNLRGMRQGAALKEMGYTNRYDSSLGMALSDCNPSMVRPDLQRALEKWLDDNRAIK